MGNYLFILVGLALLGVGVVDLFRRTVQGQTKLKMLGFEVESAFPGIILVAIGGFLFYRGAANLVEADKLRLTDVSVSVDGRTGPQTLYYNTRCPDSVTVTGSISVVGSGTVSYRFVRKQGLNNPEIPTEIKLLSVGRSGTIPVQDTVTVTPPEGEFYYTDLLEVVDPGSRRSEPVGFTVRCSMSNQPPPRGIPPPPNVLPPGR